MNFSYVVRLLCLSFASFFVLNAVLTVLVRAVSSYAIALSASRTPGAAARFLFTLRMLPAALAALFVFGLCVPSYLWLEPSVTSEQISLVCAVFGILAAAACSNAVTRSARALMTALRFNRLCASRGTKLRVPGVRTLLLVIESQAPVLAMAGVFRPRLVISRSVLNALSPAELRAALRHEQSHLSFRDNLKRLLLLLAPDFFPFRGTLRNLERNWSRFIEWAADDQAVAGDSVRAASLAAALVRVARLGSATALPALSTSLLACDHDLSARVDRLLHSASAHESRPASRAWFFGTSALFAAALLSAVLLAPFLLSSVHNLLEGFLR